MGEEAPLLGGGVKEPVVSDYQENRITTNINEKRELDSNVPPNISSEMSRFEKAKQRARQSMSLRESSRVSALLEEITKSERSELGAAVLLLRDALLGTNETDYVGADSRSSEEFFNSYENQDTKYSFILYSRRMLGRKFFASIVNSSVWIMVGLSFFEPPMWCASLGDGRCHNLLSQRGKPAFTTELDQSSSNIEYYPNYHSFLLTAFQAQIIEIVCLIPILFHLIFELGTRGFSISRYLNHPSGAQCLVRLCRMLSLLGILAGNFMGIFVLHRPVIVNQYLRIILCVTFSKDIIREIRTVMKLLPEVVYAFLLFLIVLTFYAWIGTVAFYDTEEGQLHFSNLVESMWTLWICVTTANYPDVMMAAYNNNRFVNLFFVSFMIVEFYGFMNVILAVVVNFYSRVNDEYEHERQLLTDNKLERAFRILDKNGAGQIGRETVMELFPLLNEDCPDIKYIKSDTAELLFAVLDRDGSSEISLVEFKEFGQVMLLEFDRAENYMSFFEWRYPGFYFSPGFQKICNMVNSGNFDHFIDALLVLNAFVVAIQSYPELVGKSPNDDPHLADGYIDTPWEVAESLFTIIYCVEMILKISVLGWRRYIHNRRNFFDATITLLTVAATLYVYYPNAFSDSRLIRYVVMTRVLRLFRLVIAIKDFQVIGNTMLSILPSVKRIFLLLFSVMYIFAVFGVHRFGGMITRDPDNPLSIRLIDTDFAENDYWANNFNDLFSGMNVLFNLLVVNNWPEQSSGIIAVTQSHWTRFFFIFFHIAGVVIVSNLFIATLIDSFMDEWKKEHPDQDNSMEIVDAEFTDAGALFDASEITGTKTNLSGRYVAKMKTSRGRTREAQRQNMQHLFIRTKSSNASDNLTLSERSNNA